MSRAKPCDGKVYAQTQGQKPFNWNRFLSPKTQRSKRSWEAAEFLAGDWVTCACGNQCAVIPRNTAEEWWKPFGAPKDDQLDDLGVQFAKAIDKRDLAGSREILAKIEARSTAILISMGHLKPARKPAAKRRASRT